MSKILLVEDERQTALILRRALEKAGHEMQHVSDGLQAVAAAQSWRPDLIILDVELPEQDGFAACNAIRSSPQGGEPIIVMLTSREDLASKLKGFESGADDYLIKPLDSRELRTRVTKLLGARTVQEERIARRRREAIAEIAAAICHELASPLTGAIGMLDLALEAGGLPQRTEQWLNVSRSELLRIREVVRGLQMVEDRVIAYVGEHRMIDLQHGAKPAKADESDDPSAVAAADRGEPIDES